MISPGSIVGAGKNQISADLAGEAMILNLETGIYYGLAGVGARIWELIHEPTRVADIRDTILQEYEVELERCERDLVYLLEQLVETGLIEVRDEATP